MYKVKEEDLIGDIKDFPIEVVQWMVECQVEQGKEANVKVFQRDRYKDILEKESFWHSVVIRRDFDLFFEKYAKRKSVLEPTSAETVKENSDFKTILNSIGDLLEYKNSNYGNAVLEPLNIFAGKTKAGIRLDDKLSRIKNSETLRKNDVADVIGYLVLVCKENNWTNFDEYKD